MNEQNDIDFFCTPDGKDYYKTADGFIGIFDDTVTNIINKQFDIIIEDYTSIYKELANVFKSSEINKQYFKYLIVRQFNRCNFSVADTQKFDFEGGSNFNIEQVPCPLKGIEKLCPFKCKVCNAKMEVNLTNHQKKILELYCRPMNVDKIADILFISEHTVREHLKKIRAKTGCHDKASLMKLYETKIKM